jgi:hypothetical protein
VYGILYTQVLYGNITKVTGVSVLESRGQRVSSTSSVDVQTHFQSPDQDSNENVQEIKACNMIHWLHMFQL